MKKNKISILQISRLIIQIIFFIFLPALYINTFAGIKQIYIALINQNTGFMELLPQLIEVLVIIPVTIILGRFFCGWMCAFGAFGDFIYGISNKLFKIKFKMNENVDRTLKYVKYVLLAFLIFIVCTFNITAFSSFSPWDVFGMLAAVGKATDFSYVLVNLTAGFILFILIVVGSIFIERFFCRYLCPLGAVFAVTSKLRIVKIRKTRTKCGNCRICTNNCAMGIPLYKTDVVNSGECINCMKCIKACPRKNVTLTVSGDDVRPLIVGAAAVSVMTGLYYAGNIGVNAAGLNNVQLESQSSQSNASGLYLDGTYEGSGIGFRNRTTTVSVAVKNGKISDITSVSYGDDRKFYNRAFNAVTEEIIGSQLTDVDTVSGATFSSNGIMEAVADALSNAKLSIGMSDSSPSAAAEESEQKSSESSDSMDSSSKAEESNEMQTGTSEQSQAKSFQDSLTPSENNVQQDISGQSKTEATSDEAVSTGTQYKDGTYEGNGTGFRGGATAVSVVVKSGKVTDINTISYEDDKPFFRRAFNTVTQEIINNQSSNVDGVSGATFSSRGIMEAVADALSKAV